MFFNRLIRSYSSAISDDKLLLKELNLLVKELQNTNSTNSKIQILKNKMEIVPELKSLLKVVYSPETRFHIKSASIEKAQNSNENCADSSQRLLEILGNLSKRNVTGNAAAQLVKNYISSHKEYEELVKNIIDKNLKARIGYDLINRAINLGNQDQDRDDQNCIPCSLGYPIEKHLNYFLKSLKEKGETWYISRKYDGIRAFLVYDHVKCSIKLLSRQMKPITTLNPTVIEVLRTDLSRLKESVVLDGELVYLNDEKEDFSKTVSIVKSLEAKGIDGLNFRAFDIIKTGLKFGERGELLNNYFMNYFTDAKILKMVNQRVIKDFDQDELIKRSIESGYEGFIIRRDCDLKDGRSRDLLKIKPCQDAEFRVVDYEIGPMRIVDDSGTDRCEQVLLNITFDFKGKRVNVGSGFSNAERREFAADPDKILGKIVTIKYQSESKIDGRSGNSLRFPVFKALHGSKRTE